MVSENDQPDSREQFWYGNGYREKSVPTEEISDNSLDKLETSEVCSAIEALAGSEESEACAEGRDAMEEAVAAEQGSVRESASF